MRSAAHAAAQSSRRGWTPSSARRARTCSPSWTKTIAVRAAPPLPTHACPLALTPSVRAGTITLEELLALWFPTANKVEWQQIQQWVRVPAPLSLLQLPPAHAHAALQAGLNKQAETVKVRRLSKADEEELRLVFAAFDADSNGSACNWRLLLPLRCRHRHRRRRCCCRRRRDNFVSRQSVRNAALTLPELREAIAQAGVFSDEEVAIIFRAGDTDGNRTLSFEEFRDMLARGISLSTA